MFQIKATFNNDADVSRPGYRPRFADFNTYPWRLKLFQQQVGNFFRHAFHQRKTPAFDVADYQFADISIAEAIADIIAGGVAGAAPARRTTPAPKTESWSSRVR